MAFSAHRKRDIRNYVERPSCSRTQEGESFARSGWQGRALKQARKLSGLVFRPPRIVLGKGGMTWRT